MTPTSSSPRRAPGSATSAGARSSPQRAPRLTNGHGGSGSASAPGAASSGTASGSASQGASFDEVELKQELAAEEADEPPGSLQQRGSPQQQPLQQQQLQQRSLQDRRASSPFANGRTELLIPGEPTADGPAGHAGVRMRTTALVEHQRPPTDEEWSVR